MEEVDIEYLKNKCVEHDSHRFSFKIGELLQEDIQIGSFIASGEKSSSDVCKMLSDMLRQDKKRLI